MSGEITAGTQVRLAGVVAGPTRKGDEAIGVQILGATAPADMVFVIPKALEIIRQPFKRGEVVWDIRAERLWTVARDEDPKSGDVFVVGDSPGDSVFCCDPYTLERRS